MLDKYLLAMAIRIGDTFRLAVRVYGGPSAILGFGSLLYISPDRFPKVRGGRGRRRTKRVDPQNLSNFS